MKASKKVAFSSILAAISVIMMLIGSFFGSLDLTSAAIASFCVILAVIELGYKSSVIIYAVASALALLLLPSKSPAVFFSVFFGYYPIVKSVAERYSVTVSYVIKAVNYTVAYAALGVLLNIFMPQAAIKKYIFVGYFIAFAVFLVYDIALTRLISLYFSSLRSRLGVARFFGNNQR